jgi:hypothetical protein
MCVAGRLKRLSAYMLYMHTAQWLLCLTVTDDTSHSTVTDDTPHSGHDC